MKHRNEDGELRGFRGDGAPVGVTAQRGDWRTDGPLIIYRAGSIDAEAAARLLQEHKPERRAVPLESWDDCDDVSAVHYSVGLGDNAEARYLTIVEPTANACMAMLVWRELNGGTGATNMDHCAPTWLRYLDDAVCGRWDLPHSKAVWAAVESWGPVAWYHILRASFLDAREVEALIREGRAILRARERWEEQIRGKTRHCHHFGPISRFCILLDRFVEWDEPLTGRVHEENRRLSAERNEFAQTILRLEGERREAEARVKALEAELESALETATCCVCADIDEGDRVCWSCVDEHENALRAKIEDAESRCNEARAANLRRLREALRIGDCVEARYARDWAKLHKIAGMDSTTDPP